MDNYPTTRTEANTIATTTVEVLATGITTISDIGESRPSTNESNGLPKRTSNNSVVVGNDVKVDNYPTTRTEANTIATTTVEVLATGITTISDIGESRPSTNESNGLPKRTSNNSVVVGNDVKVDNYPTTRTEANTIATTTVEVLATGITIISDIGESRPSNHESPSTRKRIID